MALLPIHEDGDTVLRSTAAPVPRELFGTPELDTILANMEETLNAEADGVAIAAPQVGIPYRIFLVRFDRIAPVKPGEDAPTKEVGVFINPEIRKLSRKNAEMDEGCLSVRGVYGKTIRKERATVHAYDATGTAFTRGAGGILAQAFQHEIDHLNGILFIDHALELWKPKKHDTHDTV